MAMHMELHLSRRVILNLLLFSRAILRHMASAPTIVTVASEATAAAEATTTRAATSPAFIAVMSSSGAGAVQ